jgi:hypothetical protein
MLLINRIFKKISHCTNSLRYSDSPVKGNWTFTDVVFLVLNKFDHECWFLSSKRFRQDFGIR